MGHAVLVSFTIPLDPEMAGLVGSQIQVRDPPRLLQSRGMQATL